MVKVSEWVEIPVTELPRAVRFYEATLGGELRVAKFFECEMAILPYARAGVGGALVKAAHLRPAHVCLKVGTGEATLDAALCRACEAGGAVLTPKSPSPDGWFALIRDSEGNAIALQASATPISL